MQSTQMSSRSFYDNVGLWLLKPSIITTRTDQTRGSTGSFNQSKQHRQRQTDRYRQTDMYVRWLLADRSRRPHWPLLLGPNVYTSPRLVNMAPWALPRATDVTTRAFMSTNIPSTHTHTHTLRGGTMKSEFLHFVLRRLVKEIMSPSLCLFESWHNYT